VIQHLDGAAEALEPGGHRPWFFAVKHSEQVLKFFT
jgi:hypothetical protein